MCINLLSILFLLPVVLVHLLNIPHTHETAAASSAVHVLCTVYLRGILVRRVLRCGKGLHVICPSFRYPPARYPSNLLRTPFLVTCKLFLYLRGHFQPKIPQALTLSFHQIYSSNWGHLMILLKWWYWSLISINK